MLEFNPTSSVLNGFTIKKMQSQLDTDKLICAFKSAIDEGKNPNEVRDEIFDKYNIYEDNLTYNDKNRLIHAIEKYYYNLYHKHY